MHDFSMGIHTNKPVGLTLEIAVANILYPMSEWFGADVHLKKPEIEYVPKTLGRELFSTFPGPGLHFSLDIEWLILKMSGPVWAVSIWSKKKEIAGQAQAATSGADSNQMLNSTLWKS